MVGEGSLLIMNKCNKNKSTQQWIYTDNNELITNTFGYDLCITSGWPFLNAVSFEDPNGKIVSVITNEAPTSTVISFIDSEIGHFEVNMPSNSIQTITY